MEVTNRFKELHLLDRMPKELWMEVCNIVQEAVTKIIPKKRNARRQNGLSKKVLQIAEKRREVKSKGERERYTQLNEDFQRLERRDKKPFFKKQCKEIGGNKICTLLQIPSRKLEMPRKHFLQR